MALGEPKQRIQWRDSPLAIRLLETKGKNRVGQICIIIEFVRRAARRAFQRPLQLTVVSKHIRVPVDDHVVATSVLDVSIDRAFFGQIRRLQLDMVLVAVDTERTLE